MRQENLRQLVLGLTILITLNGCDTMPIEKALYAAVPAIIRAITD